jgi:8-oxo-dGTP diphosphatase
MIVLRNGDSFMLLKRYKSPHKDMYTPVGGKLDPYENPLQAAFRETEEETGIKLDELKFAGILTETAPANYNWICYVYEAEIEKMEAPFCDEGILEWVDFDQIPHIPTPATDFQIYKYIMEGKRFVFSADFDEHINMLSMREELEDRVLFPN